MAEKFEWTFFYQINLSDKFFNSLKEDYAEFSEWFIKKQKQGAQALVYHDEEGIGAFLYLKKENVDRDQSTLVVNGKALPMNPRLKIGTLRLAERIRKQRLGEGALGVALWYWKETKYDEIYVTIFEKHIELIRLFERFGFCNIGKNERGECVFVKNRNHISYDDAYKSFPFVNPCFDKAGIIPINDTFHDKLFPYSELYGGPNKIAETTAGNGVSKIFIASPYTPLQYEVGMPVYIYRKHTGEFQKAYKSVVTSYCTINSVEVIKENGKKLTTIEEFINQVGNKSIYTREELAEIYNDKKTVIIVELVYNGYFGKGHNVTYKSLKEKGLFDNYPYSITYDKNDFIKILEMGDVDVQNTIID